MATAESTSNIDAQLAAEFAEALRAALSGQRDPELMRRACERMDRMRDETYREQGVVDIGVSAIRELRGELPDA